MRLLAGIVVAVIVAACAGYVPDLFRLKCVDHERRPCK